MNPDLAFVLAMALLTAALLLYATLPIGRLLKTTAPHTWPYEIVFVPTIICNYWTSRYLHRSVHTWSLTVRWLVWEVGIAWRQ